MVRFSVLLCFLALVFSCHKQPPVPSGHYDFEALRDSLGLNDNCVFVQEFSPEYSDNNPYGFDEEYRVKALFYQVFSSKEGHSENDTVVHAVLRNNDIVFWGCNEYGHAASTLIDWSIKNREKI